MPTRQTILKDNLSAVVMDDLNTVVKIAGVLQARGKRYSLKGEGLTTLSDLRNGPSVFVGAFDNAWTLRLTKPLRFHFANNAEMTRFWIADQNDPGHIRWLIDRPQQQATNNYRDYAIVTRFTDSNTGKIAIVAAGVGRGGTIAAGEFLIDPTDLGQVVNAARAAGKKNLEIVLSTEIIDGLPLPCLYDAPDIFSMCSSAIVAGIWMLEGTGPPARSNCKRRPRAPAGSNARLILPKRVGESRRT
jgi:hypothetical protein